MAPQGKLFLTLTLFLLLDSGSASVLGHGDAGHSLPVLPLPVDNTTDPDPHPMFNPHLDDDSKAAESRNYLAEESKRWPGGVVPYTIDASIPAERRADIEEAIRYLETISCVDFVEKTDETDYVIVHQDPGDEGCHALPGYHSGHGAHSHHLGPFCFQQSVIIHEFLHNLGASHEQTRPDRDIYVNILWNKINPANRHNFYKKVAVGDKPGVSCRDVTNGDYSTCDDGFFVSTFDLPYDYASIMHYGPIAFPIDGVSATIEAKDPSVGTNFGMSQKPTLLDEAKLNMAYGCFEECLQVLQGDSGIINGAVNGAAKCRWDIMASEKKNVVIQFHSFKFGDCSSTVTVRTPSQPGSPRDQVFCSTNVPTAVIVYENQATILLDRSADQSNEFYATFHVVDGKDGCCFEVTYNVPITTASNFYQPPHDYQHLLGNYRKDGTFTVDYGVTFPVYREVTDPNRYLAHDNNTANLTNPWFVWNDGSPGSTAGHVVFGPASVLCPGDHTKQQYADFILDPPAWANYDGSLTCVPTVCNGSALPTEPTGFTLEDAGVSGIDHNQDATVSYQCTENPDFRLHSVCSRTTGNWTSVSAISCVLPTSGTTPAPTTPAPTTPAPTTPAPTTPSPTTPAPTTPAPTTPAPTTPAPTKVNPSLTSVALTDSNPCISICTPGYDEGKDYMPGLNLRWYFHASGPATFQVTIDPSFDINNIKGRHGGPCADYALVREGRRKKRNGRFRYRKSRGPYCGSVAPPPIAVSNPFGTKNYVAFVSDEAGDTVGAGFRATICKVVVAP